MKQLLLKSKKTGSRLIALSLIAVMILSITVAPSVFASEPVIVDSETKQDLDTTKEALSDLADCLDQPGAKIVTNMLFNSVFGNDDNDVEHALQRIVSQLDQIQKQMSNLVDKIENTSIRTMLKNQISNYHNVSKQFKVAYKVYLESERIINELP